MKKDDPSELTKEQIQRAMACKTADELLALAKSDGIEMTRAEAEAYIAEMADFEMDKGALAKKRGDFCWDFCGTECGKPSDFYRASRH